MDARPKAIRAVADYVRQRNAIISAFYLSNVEYYLTEPRGKLQSFYQNAAA